MEDPLPPLAVTETVTPPAVCAGVVAVIVVLLVAVIPVALAPPKVTAVAPVKPLPVIVTDVPPPVGPLLGLMLVTVGVARYVYPPAKLPLCVSGFVTTTLTAVPADPAGATAVRLVALLKVTPVAAVAPNLTVAPLWNPVPVIATDVPPAAGPEVGLMLVTDGAAL
jgi:hypothetical protein